MNMDMFVAKERANIMDEIAKRPTAQLNDLLNEQRTMVCDLIGRLECIDSEIGLPFMEDNDTAMEKQERNIINFLCETNRILHRCYKIANNISCNVGVD